jgi:beta-galactosidase
MPFFRALIRRRCLAVLAFLVPLLLPAARREVPLREGWHTSLAESPRPDDSAVPALDPATARVVEIPHNWDGYEGFRQVKHGPLHATAVYARDFELIPADAGRRVFLFFEGVGSYARVWVNGVFVGDHAGGLTTFTLDVTGQVRLDTPNRLVVEAHHPDGIRDLPWVCGGCEQAYGFSEGTQPFGISRPVTLVVTDPLRVEPFGVHVWNHEDISREEATIHFDVEVGAYGEDGHRFHLRHEVLDPRGKVVVELNEKPATLRGSTLVFSRRDVVIPSPLLWHPEHPYRYTLVTEILRQGTVVDRVETPFGIRTITWPDLSGPAGQPLLVNGQPFFVNGVADYEHLLGQSHAFSDAQVEARARQIRAAGFNAFRDAHHPHNLRFQEHWDRHGVLWWTQFGAHIWFDNEPFRENYRRLLRDWVRERRNSPSLFLYTLQNESKLPAWFTAECAEIIRSLDPTARVQRLVVTCNGGKGSDWDVPQNWSGTYGGDPHRYGEELIQQRLVGEYGAWRSLDFHHEGGFFREAPLTEDRMTSLFEIKVAEAEAVRDRVIGHFMWPFTTHQNPGRNVGSHGEQSFDGIRPLDRIGPANNKGLFTIWGEPTDAFFMYRARYTDPADEPVVYLVSPTWPDRWAGPGVKDGIVVYANCDEVELFNGERSLGVRHRDGHNPRFQWDGVEVTQDTLIAVGRHGGETVAKHRIHLHHLPPAPPQPAGLPPIDLLAPLTGATYLYRVNCGGPAFTDARGHVWQADRVHQPGEAWGSSSWAERFPNLDPRFGSRRPHFNPRPLLRDPEPFRAVRYGREELRYRFAVPPGTYTVELFFHEPWYAHDGLDATGWRLFDVALNGKTVLRDFDLARTGPTRQRFEVEAADGRIEVGFPRVAAGQAVISAIAIASAASGVAVPPPPRNLLTAVSGAEAETWLDTGVRFHRDAPHTLRALSWELRDTEWLRLPLHPEAGPVAFTVTADANLYAAFDAEASPDGEWEPTPHHFATTAAPEEAVPLLRRRVVADTRVAFSAPPRALLAERRMPPPPALSVFDFAVERSHATEGWQAVGNLRAGAVLYSDGGPAIARFASRLSDCDWIRPAQADAANPEVAAHFRVEDHTELHLALDERVTTRPAWMADFIPSRNWRLHATDDDAQGFFFWVRRYLPGETVTLGPNGTLPDGSPARMYLAAVRPVRPAFSLEVEEQPNSGGLVASSLSGYTGRGYVDLARHEGEPFALFFEVGVGDRYGLNMRYHSRSSEPITLDVTIRNTADGFVICTDRYTFPPTGEGHWAIQRERTCQSTNAGLYAVELSGPGLRDLVFDSLEVE